MYFVRHTQSVNLLDANYLQSEEGLKTLQKIVQDRLNVMDAAVGLNKEDLDSVSKRADVSVNFTENVIKWLDHTQFLFVESSDYFRVDTRDITVCMLVDNAVINWLTQLTHKKSNIDKFSEKMTEAYHKTYGTKNDAFVDEGFNQWIEEGSIGPQ